MSNPKAFEERIAFFAAFFAALIKRADSADSFAFLGFLIAVFYIMLLLSNLNYKILLAKN